MRATYLDHASTSRWKGRGSLDAISAFLREVGVGPGRGSHRLSRESDEMVIAARESVGRLVGARNAREIVFTSNATQSLNTAIQGIVTPGCHVVTTSYEHNSVLRPLEALFRAGMITYTVVESDAFGRLDLFALEGAFTPATSLVIVNHASNVTGAVAPVSAIVAVAKARGALVLLDAAQTAGFLELGDDALGCDLVAITGHKSLRGPSGTGALYVRDGVSVEPLMFGGSGTNSASPVHPRGMPERLEAGTPNYLGIAGLAAAADAFHQADRAHHRDAVRALTDLLHDQLLEIPGIDVVPVPDPRDRVGIVSVTCDRYAPAELGAFLDSRGVYVRAGLQCAPRMHVAMGTAPLGTVRFSLGWETDAEDIAYAAAAVREAVRSVEVGR